MQLFILIALLPLAVLVDAGSASLPLRRRVTSLNESRVSSRSSRFVSSASLQAELQKTRVKYGIGKDRRRAVGTVPLQEESGDASYYGAMTIGGNSYNIILDTGSADLVVAASGCSTCDSSTPLYDPSASSTASSTGTPFSITYGTGAASGSLVSDTISIGGFSVASQVFAACDTFDNLLSGDESGLLGMGWQSLASSGAMPFVQALYEAGDFDSPEFGLGFDGEEGGTLTLGGVDTAATAGDLNYVSLVDSGSYWQVALDGVKVNGVEIGVSASSVIIDSGTTLISMPASAVSSIYAAVSSESVASGELMLYPCATSVTLSLSFGGVYYDVPAADFSYGTIDEENSQCYGVVYDASEGTSDSTYIIGAAFLQHVYSAYRFSEPAVGFANLAGSSSSATASSVASSAAAPSSTPVTILPSEISTLATIVESTSTSDFVAPSSSPTDIASSSAPASSESISSSTFTSDTPISSGFSSITVTSTAPVLTATPSDGTPIDSSSSSTSASPAPTESSTSDAAPFAQVATGLLGAALLLAILV